MDSFVVKLITLTAFLAGGGYVFGQTVTTGLTPQEYISDILLGSGITASNITFTGFPEQLGHLEGFTPANFPISDGLVMSCGPTSELIPDTGGDCTFDGYLENIGVTGEADLLSDAVFVANYYGFGQPTAINDVCILEFDFVAAGDSMSFDYIFASSEYPSDPNNPGGAYVNTQWNDAFGFYLSGPGINGPYANNAVNIAGIPDPAGAGLLPITVSSVNGIQNTQYFIENTNLDGICMRGYTTVLTAAYNDLECGATYHIKLAIGDGSDTYLTSMVILGSETFESNAVVDINLNIDVGADVVNNPPVLYEDCGTATMVFSRPLETNLNLEESIEIVYSGTSTYGVDYTALPTTVTFPPNVSTQEFSISAVLDGVSEGPESVEMQILNLAACNGGGLTSFYEFNINDTAEPLQVDGFTTSLCTGDSVLLTPVISGGYGNFIFDWDCNPGVDTSEYNFLANAPGLFNCLLTVTDTCGMPSDDGFFEVDVVQYPAMTVDIGPDVLLPCNGNQTVLAAVTGGNPGAGGYTYTWEDQNGTDLFSWLPGQIDISTWMGVTELTLVVEDECGMTESATISVDVDVPAMDVALNSSYDVPCNVQFDIPSVVNGGQAPYNYFWTEGFNFLGFGPTLTWTTSQDMAVTLEVNDACGQLESVTFDVNVVSPPVEVTLPANYIGPCTEDFVLTPTVSGGSGVYTYEWLQNFNLVGSGATFTYSDGLPASFTLEVTDNCQAAGIANTEVVIDNPTLIVEMPDTIDASCIDNTAIAVNIVAGAGDYSYSWTVGGIPYGGSDPQITVQSFVTTPIAVEVLDGCGGADESDALLVIPDVPMTLSVSNDTVVCRGEALSLSAIATGGEGGFVYSWSSIPAFGENQYVAPSNSFSYPVQVTDICGETLTQTVEVEVQYIYSDFYTSYLSDTRIEFIATPEPPCPNCAYDWDFGDGASSEEISPTHEYDGLGDYYAQLTITNPLGCRDSAYTLVEGPVMVYIPNAFTPNNDGINDGFQVVISDVVYFEINIFNKWGEEIFYSTDPDEIWMGNVKGGEHYAPNGLYNYRLRWKGSRTDAEEFSGTIELMR